jgi:uncharacterized protein YjbI with pentapeptide repeats
MRPRLELDPGARPGGGDVSIALDATPWRIGPSRRLTVVAKHTVQLVAAGPGHPVAADPLAPGTVELAPVLPHPQITLVGHAYAPAGTHCGMQPARVALVRGSTTVFDKSIFVYGDRTSPTDFAQPFDVMPLVHERAPCSGWNPVGRMLARGDAPPNLVPSAPGQPIACFAPIPAGFPARAAIFDPSAIRREDDLLAFGLFDFRWFQDAPFDQWLPPIEGGETLILEGLSPYVPVLATELPTMLVQASWWHAGGASGRLRLRLGRIDVDVDRGVVSLIWRGHFALPAGAALGDILVRVTTGGTTLADIAGHDADEGPPTRAHLPRPVLASVVDVSRATLADISQISQMGPAHVSRATLADVSRATLADIDVGPSSGSGLGPGSGTLPFRGPPPVAPAAPPAPPAPAAEPIAPVPPSPQEVLARLLDGTLDGETLRAVDLAGASLVNAELRGRDLRGARLSGANLDGARLQGACLDGADLTGAMLRGADLESASLVGAKLRGADLGKASFRHATLDGVDAEGARFGGADLTRSRAARGRFVRVRFEGARLDEAQWPEAALDGAALVDAFLCRATFTRGSFVRANLTRADLREASMQGAVFGGAVCDATAFDRADLSGADLAGAHLNEGALVRARTTGAKLR